MAVEKAKNVPPFVLWCTATIPTAFDDSMSYYEALCALYKWIQDNIINVVNNNADILKEYMKKVDDLKKYVDEYFDNLDVQEEINNKLDAMAESGQLADIVAQYLELACVLAYDTLGDLKDADNVVEGSICRTLGMETLNDGLGSYYKIRAITPADTVDEYNIVTLTNSNTLIAELVNFNAKEKIPEFIRKADDYMIRVGTDENVHHYLAFSTNGYEWHKLGYIPTDAFMEGSSWISSYDVACYFIDGKFYMLYDYVDTSYNDWGSLNPNFFLFGNRIGVSCTEDFVTWDKWAMTIPTTFKQTANPRLVFDGDDMYLCLTTGDGTTTNTAGTGYKHYVNLLDVDSTLHSASNSTLLISSSNSFIDAYIYKIENENYLFVRNEEAATCEEYKSSVLKTTYSNKIQDIDYRWNLDHSVVVEGYSVVYFDGYYYLFCDSVNHRNVVYISSDIENWDNCNWCDCDTRMGNALVARVNETAKHLIMEKYYRNYGYPSFDAYEMLPSETDYINFTKKTMGHFIPLPNRNYIAYYPSYDITIDKTFYNKVGRNKTYHITNGTGQDGGLKITNVLPTAFYLPAAGVAELSYFGIVSQGQTTIRKVYKLQSGALTANTVKQVSITAHGATYSNVKNVQAMGFFGNNTGARTLGINVESISADTIVLDLMPNFNADNIELFVTVDIA